MARRSMRRTPDYIENNIDSSIVLTEREKMNGFDIVMVIAIILSARLGVRVVSRYIQMEKEQKEESDPTNSENKNEP